MKQQVKKIMIGVCLCLLAAQAQAGTIRATELGANFWSQMSSGVPADVTIEFRQGDELPVNFLVQGDLIATTQSTVSYVGVKRDFWIKLVGNNVSISLDGTVFNNISSVVTGGWSANAASDQNPGVAKIINFSFSTFLR